MFKSILAGVYDADMYTTDKKQHIGSCTALTKESIDINTQADEIRGGASNGLLQKYYHNSSFKVTLTDAEFSLEYVALKTGSTIQMAAQVSTQEQVTVTEAGKIKVSNKPTLAPDETGSQVLGFYRIVGAKTDEYTPIVLDTESKEGLASDVKVGDVVCVKYFYNDEGSRKIVVPSNIVPHTVYLVMRIPELASSSPTQDISSNTIIGEIQVQVPRFLLNPATKLEITASGHATMNLDGEALKSYDKNSCNDEGHYAYIVEKYKESDALKGATGLYVVNSNIDDLAIGQTVDLTVKATYGGLTMPSVVSNEKLTFVSKDKSIATVTADGKVTAVGAGTVEIEIVATNDPTKSCVASVEVVGA